jgi:ceramide glucosyltransferase
MSVVFFIVALASASYLAIANLRMLAFAWRPLELASEFLPSMTILKPILGSEPELYENLRSFCDQEYDAPFEVIFAIHDAADSARQVLEHLAAEFPDRVRIAVGENAELMNPKIANLAKPDAEPRGELVVIADSDIRVGREYLRALAASFASEHVGAATCLYSAMPNESVVARLGALQIEEVFIPSVLVALSLGRLRFCMGASMAVRRRLLEEIGGLAALGNVLADDHRLGELVTERNREVELSRYVVRTSVPERTIAALWSHELRWARTNFALAPAGYVFSFLMYALPLALLYLAVSRNLAVGLPLLAAVIALRVGLHYLSRWALKVAHSDDAALIPVRDFLSLAVWCASFFGRRVLWRSKTYLATHDESG